MQLYAILRRSGRTTPEEIDAATEQSTVVSLPTPEAFETVDAAVVRPDPEQAAAA